MMKYSYSTVRNQQKKIYVQVRQNNNKKKERRRQSEIGHKHTIDVIYLFFVANMIFSFLSSILSYGYYFVVLVLNSKWIVRGRSDDDETKA